MKTLPLQEETPEEKAARLLRLKKEQRERENQQMEEHLVSLKNEAKKSLAEHERLLRLKEKYPDLRYERDRWKTIRYKSAAVNGQCNHYEWTHTCGCCPDAGILAMPYIETELGRVYSDPFHMEVGEGRSYSFMQEHHGWQERYRKAGISEDLIRRIKSHLDHEIEESREEEDDEYDD